MGCRERLAIWLNGCAYQALLTHRTDREGEVAVARELRR